MHAELLAFLDQNQIPYQRFSHPPVFTCEEARQVAPDLPGADTKNLFLRDGKGKRHFLVTVPDHKSVNLKALSAALEVKNLTFASPERLLRFLGVTPGAVTLLGVFNDSERAVEVVLDVGFAQGHARGTAVNHAANGRAVGFTEVGDAKKGA